MNKDFLKNIFYTIVLTMILVFSYLWTKKEHEFNPFTLNLGSNTEILTLETVSKNKITLLYFGFLSCPDACPTTLNTVSNVFKNLTPDELSKINFLFIDLDPERDTLDKLKEYTHFFHPVITPVHLPIKELDMFTRFFGIAYMKVPLKSSMGYTIDHSTDIIVLSPEKKILPPIHHGTPKMAMLTRVKEILSTEFKK